MREWGVLGGVGIGCWWTFMGDTSASNLSLDLSAVATAVDVGALWGWCEE